MVPILKVDIRWKRTCRNYGMLITIQIDDCRSELARTTSDPAYSPTRLSSFLRLRHDGLPETPRCGGGIDAAKPAPTFSNAGWHGRSQGAISAQATPALNSPTRKFTPPVFIFFSPQFYAKKDLAESIMRVWGGWYFVINVLVATIVYYFGQQHFINLRTLKNAIETYDVRNGQLSSACDRPLLLRHINDLFFDEGNDAADAGMDLFNQAVRTQVPAFVTLSGYRSWKLLSYLPAILIASQVSLYPSYDFWGFQMRTEYPGGVIIGNPQFKTASSGFFATMGIAHLIFIITPIYMYLYGAQVRLFLALQDWLKCKWWALLPLFFALEAVFVPRYQAIEAIFFLCSSTMHYAGGDAKIAKASTTVTWQPFKGIQFMLPASFAAETVYQAKIQLHGWSCVLIWLFLITPTTIFCYIIYEPRSIRQWRQKYWLKYCGSKDDGNNADPDKHQSQQSEISFISSQDTSNNSLQDSHSSLDHPKQA